MEALVIWIAVIAFFYIRKKRADEANRNRNRQTPPVAQAENPFAQHPTQHQRPRPAQQVKKAAATVAREAGKTLSEAKSGVNRSLAGMNDGDVEQPTKIETRRKAQQATADKSRIHQGLHEKEELEARKKEAAMQQAMAQPPQRFEFEDSDLMAEVQDLIVCGYPTQLKNQRDFISEGTDFLNRLSSGEA